MKKLRLVLLLFIVTAFIAGCAGTQKAQIDKNIPDSSPLAKIEKDMPAQQVIDLIGSPKSQNVFTSGKQWIPFYYGTDTTRTVFYYENQGRVTFNANNRVIEVEYDKNEDGYK